LPRLHGTAPTVLRVTLLYTAPVPCQIVKDYDGDPETRESLLACLFTSQSDRRIESNLGDRPPPCTCSGCTDPNHALSFPSFVALHLHRTVSRIPKGQAAAGQACILSRACRHTASHTGTERYALVPSPSLPGRPDAASSSYTFIVACLLCPRGLGSCIAHLPGRAGEVGRFISIRKAGEATVGVLGG
jgi:hypothetical protein